MKLNKDFLIKEYKNSNYTIQAKATALIIFGGIFSLITLALGIAMLVTSTNGTEIGVYLLLFTSILSIIISIVTIKGKYLISSIVLIYFFTFLSAAGIMNVLTESNQDRFITYVFAMLTSIIVAALFGSKRTIIIVSLILIFASILFMSLSSIIANKEGLAQINFKAKIMTPGTLIMISALSYISSIITNKALKKSQIATTESEENLNRLNKVFNQTKISVEKLSESSTFLAQSSTSINEKTQEQASDIEEIAASIEEILSTIEQNNNDIETTNRKAEESAILAKQSGEAVENTVHYMNEIIKSISDITEFSAQTNLLALNAAIEAARAGESGKGFSVVAAEVKKLAEKSSETTASIIETAAISQKASSTTVELINKLTPNINETAQLSELIRAASDEQKIGIEQINNAIIQLNEITQNNVIISQQLKEESTAIKDQADLLNDLTHTKN